jgi:hypothetical protein
VSGDNKSFPDAYSTGVAARFTSKFLYISRATIMQTGISSLFSRAILLSALTTASFFQDFAPAYKTTAEAAGCLTMQATQRGRSGTYYTVHNRCGYNAWLRFVAGYDSTHRPRARGIFIPRGDHETFVYDPQPQRYSYARAN